MNLTKFGVIGSLVTGLCCFTPILIILFGAVGLGWLLTYLDYVLLPAFIGFIGLTVYAMRRGNKLNESTGKL